MVLHSRESVAKTTACLDFATTRALKLDLFLHVPRRRGGLLKVKPGRWTVAGVATCPVGSHTGLVALSVSLTLTATNVLMRFPFSLKRPGRAERPGPRASPRSSFLENFQQTAARPGCGAGGGDGAPRIPTPGTPRFRAALGRDSVAAVPLASREPPPHFFTLRVPQDATHPATRKCAVVSEPKR
jgi:hypothetical protein